MKKVLSVFLSLVIIITAAFAVPASAQAASVGKVNGLGVAGFNASGVTLKWKKVNKATGYQVYCSTKKNKGYKKVKTVKNGKTVKATVKKLQPGKKYYFKVRAVKGKKKGAFSKRLCVKIPSESQNIINKLIKGYLYLPWVQDIGMYEYTFKPDGTFKINEYAPVYKNGERTDKWEFIDTEYAGNQGEYKVSGNKITLYRKNMFGNPYTSEIYYDEQMKAFRTKFYTEEDNVESAGTYDKYYYSKSKMKVSDMPEFYDTYANQLNYIPNP